MGPLLAGVLIDAVGFANAAAAFALPSASVFAISSCVASATLCRRKDGYGSLDGDRSESNSSSSSSDGNSNSSTAPAATGGSSDDEYKEEQQLQQLGPSSPVIMSDGESEEI